MFKAFSLEDISEAEACKDMFDRLDANHDGVLSRAEWQGAMQAMQAVLLGVGAGRS